MGCAILSLLFGMPRLAIFLLWWLKDGWLERAIDGTIWLVLGFLFMPWTVLAFAYGFNSLGAPGEMTPLAWLLTGIAVLLDIGAFGGGARQRRKKAD